MFLPGWGGQRVDLPTDALLFNYREAPSPLFFSPSPPPSSPFDPSYQIVVDDLESISQNNNNYSSLKVLRRPLSVIYEESRYM